MFDPMHDLTRRQFVGAAAALGAGLVVAPDRLARVRTGAPGGALQLANGAVRATWSIGDGALRAEGIEDLVAQRRLALPRDAFTLMLADGRTLRASAMRVTGARVEDAPHATAAARAAEREAGRQAVVDLAHEATGLRVRWRGILREGSRYVRQELTLSATQGDVPITAIMLLDLDVPGASVVGTVNGSPVAAGDWFFGFEHPLSHSTVEGSRLRCVLPRELPLRPGSPVVCSSVIGAVDPGQRRRGFLAYLERERAHPYRPFLHYNSWYDLGYFSPYDEAQALGAINAFGLQLHRRRGVTLDSFLFDDGWDDHQTLWHFNAGFPHGFTPLRDAAARYGAGIGVWLSPWGGYGTPRQERLAAGRAQGFEENEGGFALSGPKYFARFRETCLRMIHRYGVNQFKFDGTGNVRHAIPGSAFDSDFDAMIALIEGLRAEQPDLFVNLTTGTYPSPFFLRYADAIWRGGDDHAFAGVGSKRQQWITYRDADTYAGVVQKGPLFPLNALMLHGLIYARDAQGLDGDPGDDFGAEIHAYFGTGTALQEMYLTPSLLTSANWDRLAEAARWARAHAPVLEDTHWIGGDPARLEPYGHAAWAGGQAVLCLRNPKDAPQQLEVDPATAFELPDGAASRYALRSPWAVDLDRPAVELQAGQPHVFTLQPFEVLTLNT
jgi:hypothetical protein